MKLSILVFSSALLIGCGNTGVDRHIQKTVPNCSDSDVLKAFVAADAENQQWGMIENIRFQPENEFRVEPDASTASTSSYDEDSNVRECSVQVHKSVVRRDTGRVLQERTRKLSYLVEMSDQGNVQVSVQLEEF